MGSKEADLNDVSMISGYKEEILQKRHIAKKRRDKSKSKSLESQIAKVVSEKAVES